VEEDRRRYLGLSQAFKDLGCALRLAIGVVLCSVVVFGIFWVIRGIARGQSSAMLWAILIGVGIIWFIVSYGLRTVENLLVERFGHLDEKIDAVQRTLEGIEDKIEEIEERIIEP
jgi:hypothetical protein